jgi:hypothetical protein
MKRKPDSAPKRQLTLAEVEAMLHAELRDAGLLFPTTEEDIAKLQASLDAQGIPIPDSTKFRALLEERERHRLALKSSANTGSSSWPDENLALAARHGAKISPASRKKMDAAWAKRSKRKSQ